MKTFICARIIFFRSFLTFPCFLSRREKERKKRVSRSDFSLDISAVTWQLDRENVNTHEFIEFATVSLLLRLLLSFLLVLPLTLVFQYIVFRVRREFLFGVWCANVATQNQPRYLRAVRISIFISSPS